MILTRKFRIKDAATSKHLERFAVSCNFVWNFCCEVQRKAESNRKAGSIKRWPTAIDLGKLCTGAAAELGIHSDTVNQVCRRFASSRDMWKRCPKFRASYGSRRALGWVPFIPRAIRIGDGDAVYLKRRLRFWKSRELDGEFVSGAFVQDARGRWYVALDCKVDDLRSPGSGSIGIDLGLKAVATLSNGETVPALKHYRRYQDALASAQRAGKAKRAKAIHAKIVNARRHHLHEQSAKIARENKLIVVGNVKSASLAKTKMAKSVLDAGWYTFRKQLEYKASRHQAVYIEADERFTSQTCSSCGSIPCSSPKGMGALGVRRWECVDCGASHDRDVNAARNILRVGLECQPRAVGIAA